MRETGYYWVEGEGSWDIAYWNDTEKRWHLAGVDGDYGGFNDNQFDFIDENRLKRE